MRSKSLYLVAFLVLAATYVQAQRAWIAGASPSKVILQHLVFESQDFAADEAEGLAFLPEAVTLSPGMTSGAILSEPIAAPVPFNALVPQWETTLAKPTQMRVEIRSGKSPDTHGSWVLIHPSEDWTLPDEQDTVGDMYVVPAVDGMHNYVQYRVLLDAEGQADKPQLHRLKLTFIDSTAGLSVQEMIAEQEQRNRRTGRPQGATQANDEGYPKPFVISRDVWCTNPACDYTEGLSYQPVTHLLLHHTVSSTGADGDSAAVVRAIWAFHTYGRGWRDIGYNYLVDTEGVIYEGHLGGDDVVGIHAAGANAGTMALAMIGTYSTRKPPDPMIESAADLFAWKAEQRDIDIFEASNALPGIDWGLPHLMGHRDVYGTTECPGGVAHALIPQLKDEVARRINLQSPHLYLDELGTSFTKSNANWYDGPLQCGHNAHSWYTYSTTDIAQAANWGEWRPDVPESGQYRIEVYAPYCNIGRGETLGARYTIRHAQGTSSVVVNQEERIGLWTSIGEYILNAGDENVIRLDDLTTTDSGRGMWFDAIRLLPLEVLPAAVTELPADGGWEKEREVDFTWRIDNPDKVKATVLQVAADEAFEERVANEIWPSPVVSATVGFSQDYGNLFWKVVVTSESNNAYSSAVSRFGIDSEPPTSAVDRIYWFEQRGLYQVFWSGQDLLNDIQDYSVDYRLAGTEEDWQSWVSEVAETSAFFRPPDAASVYAFRSQATDSLGNREEAKESADLSTEQARVFDYAVLLPLVSVK